MKNEQPPQVLLKLKWVIYSPLKVNLKRVKRRTTLWRQRTWRSYHWRSAPPHSQRNVDTQCWLRVSTQDHRVTWHQTADSYLPGTIGDDTLHKSPNEQHVCWRARGGALGEFPPTKLKAQGPNPGWGGRTFKWLKAFGWHLTSSIIWTYAFDTKPMFSKSVHNVVQNLLRGRAHVQLVTTWHQFMHWPL